MLKSMTGFGRSEMATEGRKLIVEIKSVNHRYCDISIKMSKKLGYFENGIRGVLKEYIGRGKADVFITYEDETNHAGLVRYHQDLAEGYVKALKKMAADFSLRDDLTVTVLSRYPEVLTLEEESVDEKALWQDLEKVLREAAVSFVDSRVREGRHLMQDICHKLEHMLELVAHIEQRSPNLVEEYRKRLTAKVAELLGSAKVDEAALATEITVYADKICVDEETVRLKSHIKNMKRVLEEADNVGRKLDFIAQEMNREANTILSKANDIEVSNWAIDLKTEIEKVREQIQNIE